MDEKLRDWYLHKDNQEWFDKFGESEPWITVYKTHDHKPGEKEDPFIWSFLIKPESIEEELSKTGFMQFEGYPTTGKFEDNGDISFYRQYGHEDRQSLFFRRRFTGREGYIEISQEFIHFFELYYDKPNGTYIKILEDGNEEIYIKIENQNEISMSLFHLRQYLAFKNMSLILGVVMQRFTNEPLEGGLSPTDTKEVTDVQNDKMHYAIWYQTGFNEWSYFTELIGKKVLSPLPLTFTGIYPFEEESKFEDFITGFNSNGRTKFFSCNPKYLANYFRKNPENPHYLTPIFFRKEVLSKYYANPHIYEVGDGHIRIGDLILRADTNHPDYVIVFLGDLGRDITYSEQKFWKAYNIPPIGEISKTAYQRNFLGKFADPESLQFIFKNKYKELNKKWNNEFGWLLFRPLHENDAYRLDSLRIPLSENQQEFDQQIESLTILIIDSLNKAEIDKLLHSIEIPKRSIQSIEALCNQEVMEGSEVHIKFLHSLYRLRSLGVSHRKDSKDYPIIRKEFNIDTNGYINSFRSILEQSIGMLDYFNVFINKKED